MKSSKYQYLRAIKAFSGIICASMIFIACGDGSATEKKPEDGNKQQELTRLKAQQEEISKKIKTLEDELGLENPAGDIRAKLVGTAPVKKQDFTHYIDLQGKVSTENIYVVTPRGAGGQVKSIYVKTGQPVRKGQLLLKLDDALIKQQIEQAKIQHSYLEDLLKRRQNLWSQNIGTEVELITARNNVANSEKQLALLNEQLQMTNVYSEVSGIAEQVNVRVGETFAAGFQNPNGGITIVDKSNLKASVSVPEHYLPNVKKGTAVIVEVPDIKKQFQTRISLVSQLIDPNSRSFTAEASLPDNASLQPNQLALVRIQDYQAKDAIVVPLATIQSDEKGKYVFVLKEEGGKKTARKQPVQIGEIYGENIEVLGGLSETDVLITQGFQELYEGQLVTVAAN